MLWITFSTLLLCCSSLQPNPPTWPSGVYIFDGENTQEAQEIIDEAFSNNGGTDPDLNGQWSSKRYAFLFKPGNHDVNVSIGYYTTLHGLGMVPSDVSINDVNVIDGSTDFTTGALDNFWRSAEKLCMHLDFVITNFFNFLYIVFLFCNLVLHVFWKFVFASRKGR